MFSPKLTTHLTEEILYLYSFHRIPVNITLHKHLTTFKLKHVVETFCLCINTVTGRTRVPLYSFSKTIILSGINNKVKFAGATILLPSNKTHPPPFLLNYLSLEKGTTLLSLYKPICERIQCKRCSTRDK